MKTTYTFWSTSTFEKKFGDRTVTLPVLKRFFTNVIAGESGWFAARVKLTQEKARAIADRLKTLDPGLVVETPHAQLDLL